MGNYSKDPSTFDLTQNHVAVRMQQGVPLLDSDWNEMNEILRNELSESLAALFADGCLGPDSMTVTMVHPNPPDPRVAVLIRRGKALMNGKLGVLRQPILIEANAFAAHGPDWTELFVYLSLEEREVAGPIHESIGVEVTKRVQRVLVPRVLESRDEPHLLLASVSRTDKSQPLASAKIEDLRSFTGLAGRPRVKLLIVPAQFAPMTLLDGSLREVVSSWENVIKGDQETLNEKSYKPKLYYAQKPFHEGKVGHTFGIIPLSFPPGIRLTKLNVMGVCHGNRETKVSLVSHYLDNTVDMLIATITLDSKLQIYECDLNFSLAHNWSRTLVLWCESTGSATAYLHQFSIEYIEYPEAR